MLAADQTRPILGDEALEGLVKESTFRARKDPEQVPIEVPESLVEVEHCRIPTLWDHASQRFTKRLRPGSQQFSCAATDLSRSGKTRCSEGALLPAQRGAVLDRANKEDQP